MDLQRRISRTGAGTVRGTSCRLERLGSVAQATPTGTLDTCTKSAGRTEEEDTVEEEDTDTMEQVDDGDVVIDCFKVVREEFITGTGVCQ